jgi:hypothetical protein
VLGCWGEGEGGKGGGRAPADTADDPAGLNAQTFRERVWLAAGTMTASFGGFITGAAALRALTRGTKTAGFGGVQAWSSGANSPSDMPSDCWLRGDSKPGAG